MRKDPIRKALERLTDLRSQGPSDAVEAALLELIERAPGIVVGKAAGLAAEWTLTGLAPALERAFYRLSKNGVDSDPQCWGKGALMRSLFDLAWQDAGVFAEGCRTVQLEPVYGGKEDSAVAVRTAAIGALVQLPAAPTRTVMAALADLLADPSPKVRTAAARSSVFCPPELALPLLRLRVRMGDEARVLGTCFDALLVLDGGEDGVGLVLEYTGAESDVVEAEALAALASSGSALAVTSVLERYPALSDPQLRRVLVTALGGSSTEAAVAFLCELLESAPEDEAGWALEALRPKLDDEALKGRVLERLASRQPGDLVRTL